MQNNQENFYLTANKLKINANKLLLLIVYYTEETMMDDCVLHFGIELVNCIPIWLPYRTKFSSREIFDLGGIENMI